MDGPSSSVLFIDIVKIVNNSYENEVYHLHCAVIRCGTKENLTSDSKNGWIGSVSISASTSFTTLNKRIKV